MIFSSISFTFAFLPTALAGYYLLALAGRRLAAAWLVLMSLIFYGFWNPNYLLLLLGSIAWNYGMGAIIFASADRRRQTAFSALWIGITGNLLLLCYYKYLFPTIGFLTAHSILPAGIEAHVVLPIGISFFTFTQIGYLVDSYDGKARERGLLSYLLFVTFFPHLIAGPILHNREMMPQFGNPETYRLRAENLSVGLFIFAVGIMKKVLLADPLGIVADQGFAQAHSLGGGAAAMAIFSYSMQLYFDFSGYSDMAVGIARMFGIVFPANFNSPYRASSMIDFWSRWHTTLTRYLTLYLYNPVAMRASRSRAARGLPASKKAMRNVPAFTSLIVVPTFFTMGLAGVWHGAGLTFIIFGLLHAAYLSINHAWRLFRTSHREPTMLSIGGGTALTYLAVLLAEVFFRADTVPQAVAMLGAAFGQGGHMAASALGRPSTVTARILLCGAICLFMPNTQQLARAWRPVLETVQAPPFLQRLQWRPSVPWAIIIGIGLTLALLRMSDTSKFLYFQF